MGRSFAAFAGGVLRSDTRLRSDSVRGGVKELTSLFTTFIGVLPKRGDEEVRTRA